MNYMYILECADESFYTGSTKDLERRLWEHQNGSGANHTRRRLPIKLVYCEPYDRIDDAFHREKQVQGWSRSKKQALIENNPENLIEFSKNYTQHGRPEERMALASASTSSASGSAGSAGASSAYASSTPAHHAPLPEPVEGSPSKEAPALASASTSSASGSGSASASPTPARHAPLPEPVEGNTPEDESAKLDDVIRENLEVLGYGE